MMYYQQNTQTIARVTNRLSQENGDRERGDNHLVEHLYPAESEFVFHVTTNHIFVLKGKIVRQTKLASLTVRRRRAGNPVLLPPLANANDNCNQHPLHAHKK
jgi:hypothetical protein